MLLIEYLTASMVIVLCSAFMLAAGASIVAVIKFISACIAIFIIGVPIGLWISSVLHQKNMYNRVIKGWGTRKDGVYIEAVVDGEIQKTHISAKANHLPVKETDELRCLALIYPKNDTIVEHTWRVLTIKDGKYAIK